MCYDGLDLTGTETVVPIVVTAANANFVTCTLATVAPPLNTQSIYIMIEGVVKLDQIVIDNGHNISSWPLVSRPITVLSPPNPSDQAQWDTFVQVSDAWAVTGMEVILTNDTALSFTSGKCSIALIPPSYAIPTAQEPCFKFLTSRRQLTFQGASVKGCHGLWSPRDLRETMHNFNYSRMYSNKVVSSFQITPSGATAAAITLSFSIRFELLANSQVIPTSLPPSSAVALDILFAAIRRHLQVAYCENPSHASKLMELARKVASSPEVKDAFKNILSTGSKALIGALL